MKRLILLASACILALSCSRSLVYSPSLNLPNQSLKEKEIDLQGGVELFPESRPSKVSQRNSLGVHGMISYGFGEKFNLSMKGWLAVEGGIDDVRPGLSFTGQFIQQKSPTCKLIIIPRAGFANFGDGFGLSNSVVFQKEQSTRFSWYSGLGVGWGFSDLYKQTNSLFREDRLPFGYIVMGHLGLGYDLSAELRINCELNPIYQISTYDSQDHLVISPSIGFGYILRKEEK